MIPVLGLMASPAGALNVPPLVKPGVSVGVGLVPFAQTGEVYEKVVTGVVVGLMVMDVFEEPARRQPEAGTEYVMV